MAISIDIQSRTATPRRRSRELLQAKLSDALDRIAERSPQEAARAGSKGLKLFRTAGPYDRDAIVREAERHRSHGRVRKAIREYEKVLAVDPQDMEAHAKVAPLYIRTGRKDKAKASLRRVVAWYEKQGFVDKAIAMLRLALRLDRRDLAARMHLADLLLAKGLPASAVRLLERARRAFRGKQFLRQALAVEEKILSVARDDFRAQVSKARLLSKGGKRREARELLLAMEARCAREGNGKRWRKTRWLLSRHAPSAVTAWGCFVSLFLSPFPYGPGIRRRLSH